MPVHYLKETASQTAGPYVHIGLIPHQAGFDIFAQTFSHDLTSPETKGERIGIEGRVLDGLGQPCREVLLELWQADAAGRHKSPRDPGFRGWGRTGTAFDSGLYRFDTIKPGRDGALAPYVSLWLVSRGINTGLSTRLFFADEAEANAGDPVLSLIEPHRRGTLLARREERAGGPVYVFDIRLQGTDEMVFFDV